MAFVATLTGTARSVNATNGSPNVTVTNTAGFVVGATVQGTGWAAGTKIVSFVANTSAVFSTNYTGTTGAMNVIVSSIFGSTLTIEATASADAPTWQNVFNAGFGVLQGSRSLFHPGGLTITFGSIVSGARFDHQDWTVEFGTGGRMLFDSGLLAGEQRGGYFQAGSLLIKCDGPTFVFNNWNNATPGGSSLFLNTGNLLTQGGLFRMHDARFVVRTGNNMAPAFTSVRDNMLVENLIMDYEGDAGPNASIGLGFGTILNPKIIKANSGLSRTNANSVGTITGLYYLGLFTDSPNAKFAIPNNSIMDGYAPQITSAQTFGGFQAATTETYSNIDLSSPGWGLSDIPTRYQRFGGPNEIRFPRTVSFEFNDSTGANLTGVTLYVRSGSTSLFNAVQAGDFSQLSPGIVLNWTGTGGYRVANTTANTINQVAQVRRYGFIEQSTSYSINLARYSQPFFMLTDTALAGINEATAAAITTAGINWTTKTITPTADLSYDQINARIAWELAQTTNSAEADPRSLTGENLTLTTGWSLVVNTGRTISAGTAITYFYAPTVTLNGTGKITGVYASSAGTSTTFEFQNVSVGSSLIIYDASGVTKYFQQEVTSAGDYAYYIAPGTTGTYTWAIELYGKQRQSGSFAANTGGLLFYEPIYVEDVGLDVTNKATVAAYTSLETASKFYDYTAYFRLSEQGIKLGQIATRSGTAIEIGNFSHVINQSASTVYSITGNTITTKSTSYAGDTKYSTEIANPPATITANTNEVITIEVQDANGDSSVTISASGNNQFEIWKITDATPPDDYATGVLLDTVGIGKYRFIHVDGYKMVIRDQTTNFRVVSEMEKGVYTAELFFGAAVQLAQAAEVTQINTKVDILQNAVDALPQEILDSTVETGATVVESLRLHNSVLGGVVSGGGTGVETFRDLANTKDRLISTNTATGDRTTETYDLT
jgi:hypothetical protein